jgi:hypothetical protein
MPEFNKRAVANVRVLRPENPPTVEIALPAGTSLDSVLANASLIGAVRGLVPRGCETCLSGQEFLLRAYEEVINVEFGE